MGAEAEPAIWKARPVAKIVKALLSRPREVADLVLTETAGFERLDRFDIEVGYETVVGKCRPAPSDLDRQRRALFEIEHVERDMSDAKSEGDVEGREERVARLPRQPENEIEVCPESRIDGSRHGAPRDRSAVNATERLELGIDK
jgi:hypothetical protein